MAELPQAAVFELLRPVLDIFVNRQQRKAAKEAATLRFWRDGMVSDLRAIADGVATEKTFKQLKKDMDATEGSVLKATEKLKQIRDKLGHGRLA
jgi:hypothetical protein